MFILLVSVKGVMAQSDISMATHWYNRANYNPAFIARTEYLYAFVNARQQWSGVEGAPKVLNVQLSGYVHDLHSAFGLSFVADRIGLTQATNPILTYAYRMGHKKKWSLSMGLSAGMFTHSIDGSRFDADIINDPSLLYNQERVISPDASAGIEFLSEHFVFGFSSTHLFSIGKPDNLFLNTNHRYGYCIYKNNKLKLLFYKVGLQVVNRKNFIVAEGNVFIRFKHPTGLMKGPREIFDLGLTYRSSRQMACMVGIMLTPDLRIGYAYDQSFITGYNRNGTHEIMIEYRIFSPAASTRIRCGNELFGVR
ncbi:MAG: PorP/SprF family type IX secretion system membrane protein [Bacteroidales bacterium]|nr:PorP/SprF family type IX secretion system membrane protein [Bacteroidales bacterium]MBN2762934.1 PorP/SprF family type IX secretion system membrane protein [Bacteroidales bacterium]